MSRSRHLFAYGAALLIAGSRYALRARVPDDYDSIGFVLALDDFDLARFQPHFPGYPIYVALGRLAHRALPSALDAATLVSSLAAGVTAAGLWHVARRLWSERVAWTALGLYACASLPWVLGGAALSDGTAAAFAVLAFAALAEERALVSGAMVGLMLGVRASYAPLALSWMVVAWVWRRRLAARALVAAALGVLAWLAPFAWLVGGRALVALGRVHVRGHFGAWGGSVATRPDLALRAFAFARGLFFDGIAPRELALATLLALWLLAWRGRRPARGPVLAALVIAVPYALWAFLGQNIVEQPRHLLPLILLLLLGAAPALAERAPLAIAATALVLWASWPHALAHARSTPAAAQAVEALAATGAGPRVALFGGRAIRFAHLLTPSLPAYERTWLSEVDVTLERLDVLPHHIFITSEVTADARRATRLRPGPRFCRDPVLDRAQPCLQLLEYVLREGSAP